MSDCQVYQLPAQSLARLRLLPRLALQPHTGMRTLFIWKCYVVSTMPNDHLNHSSLTKSPTFWIILANVGIYLLMVARGVDPISPLPRDLIAWGGNLGPYTLTGEWPRLLSSMFLHGGALHLGLNMFMLYQIGRVSEAAWGRMRFLLIYMVTGLFGGFASATWYSHEVVQSLATTPLQLMLGYGPATIVSVGASGALLGAAGALLVHALRSGQNAMVDLSAIVQVVLLNIGMGFLINGTDNAAHVGGALAGIAIGAVFMLMREHRSMTRLNLQSLVVAGLFLVGLSALVRTTVPQQLDTVAAGMRKAAVLAERREALREQRRQSGAAFRQQNQ